MSTRVVVVGAGIAGAACARALLESGVEVAIVDRGRAPGGRMSAPLLHERRTDLGAAYFTVADDDFAAVVRDWTDRGLAREWTDTFTVLGDGERRTTTGPTRYAAADGLRALVRDLLPAEATLHLDRRIESLADIDHAVDHAVGSEGGRAADAVVLAMPDPQAARLAPDAVDWVEYEPVIAVAAGWSQRCWDDFDAAFVNDDPDLTFLADDGARRGDGAAVLVAHSSAERAWEHLDDPQQAQRPVYCAVERMLQLTEDPDWLHAHRWTFAKPAGTHGDEPFGLLDYRGRPLGLCTDSWCPSGKPRVESAWLSGRALGRSLAARLG